MHFIKTVTSALLVASVSAASLPWGTCKDLSGVKLPVDNTNSTNRFPDTSPSPGLKLVRVAFGIGTQNYTCADRSKPPAAVGAIAKLYDADPFACMPEQLSEWCRALVQTSGGTQVFIAAALTRYLNRDLFIGDHFFADPATPAFDFEGRAANNGIFYGNGKAVMKIPAPKDACKGKAPDNNGAVPWLRITASTGYSSVGYKEVYRVNTAGGAPPASCDGLSDKFQIPYTATYFFYN